jgi:hypothetical protein
MRICFKLQICEGFGSSSADAWFSRWVEIPFVPSVGMEVRNGDWSDTIQRLVYDAADGVLFAFVERWRASRYRTADEMMSKITEAEAQGWIRSDTFEVGDSLSFRIKQGAICELH